ncbi:hypothetical protein [Streptomyces sp. bgisy031]|uniref:hypothetical protein n=1 Tax=Streptomyces sp. bgisy031 TaxID=3413772 RepID=UPI003D71E94B
MSSGLPAGRDRSPTAPSGAGSVPESARAAALAPSLLLPAVLPRYRTDPGPGADHTRLRALEPRLQPVR